LKGEVFVEKKRWLLPEREREREEVIGIE